MGEDIVWVESGRLSSGGKGGAGGVWGFCVLVGIDVRVWMGEKGGGRNAQVISILGREWGG